MDDGSPCNDQQVDKGKHAGYQTLLRCLACRKRNIFHNGQRAHYCYSSCPWSCSFLCHRSPWSCSFVRGVLGRVPLSEESLVVFLCQRILGRVPLSEESLVVFLCQRSPWSCSFVKGVLGRAPLSEDYIRLPVIVRGLIWIFAIRM